MVCLYGTTLNKIPEFVRITCNIMIKESNYSDWNWLTHLLTEFIYKQSSARLQAEDYYGQPPLPYAPHPDETTPWGHWFARMKAALEKHFNDANAVRVFSCCKNPPTEEIALIIYDACSLDEQRSFQNSLILPILQDYEEESETDNPADPIHTPPPLPPPAPTSGPPCVACGVLLHSLNSKYCTQCGTAKFIPKAAPAILPPPSIIPIFKNKPNYPMTCQCDHCISDATKNIPVKASSAIIKINAILASSSAN